MKYQLDEVSEIPMCPQEVNLNLIWLPLMYVSKQQQNLCYNNMYAEIPAVEERPLDSYSV